MGSVQSTTFSESVFLANAETALAQGQVAFIQWLKAQAAKWLPANVTDEQRQEFIEACRKLPLWPDHYAGTVCGSLFDLARQDRQSDLLLELLLKNLGLTALSPDQYRDLKEQLIARAQKSFKNDFLPFLEQTFFLAQEGQRGLQRILPGCEPFPGERPTDFEYALLSKLVYQDKATQEHPRYFYALGYCYSDWMHLGWSVYDFHHHEDSGYVGVAYLNRPRHQLVVAHRGTNPRALKSLRADVREIVDNQLGGQQQASYAFVVKLIAQLRTDDHDHINVSSAFTDYHLSFTGHSLGGWLAGMSVPKFNEAYAAWCVTFDAPGTQDMAEITEGLSGRNVVARKAPWKDWDMLHFVTAPNLVNTCGTHYPEIRRLDITLAPPADTKLGQLKQYFGYTLEQHSMTNILGVFNPTTGYAPAEKQHRVIRWPRLNMERLQKFTVIGVLKEIADIIKSFVTDFGVGALFQLATGIYNTYNFYQQVTEQYRGFLSLTDRRQQFHVDQATQTPEQHFAQSYQVRFEIRPYDERMIVLRQCHPAVRDCIRQFHLHYAALIKEEVLDAQRLDQETYLAITSFQQIEQDHDIMIQVFYQTAIHFRQALTRFTSQALITKNVPEITAIYNKLRRWSDTPVSLDLAQLWQRVHELCGLTRESSRNVTLVQQQVLETAFSSAMRANLAERYAERTTLQPAFLARALPIDRCYVHLQLVNANAETGAYYQPDVDILLESLFEKPQQHIFLSGHAGYGKTTLSHYLCYRWAMQSLWPQFAWVLHIPLRRLLDKHYNNLADMMNQLVFASESFPLAKFHEIWEWMRAPSNRKKVLLLLDGVDEVNSLPSTHPAYALLRALDQLPFARLLTSRPCDHGSAFTRRFNQELHLMGFADGDMRRYLEMAFADNQELPTPTLTERKMALQNVLDADQRLREIARAPVSLEMLCYIYRHTTNTETLADITKHRTGLYQRLLLERLRDRLARSGEYSEVVLKAMKESDVLATANTQALVIATNQLAFASRYDEAHGIKDSTQFSYSLVRKYLTGAEIQAWLQLGFVNSPGYHVGIMLADNAQLEFVHLSVHEFFAAREVVDRLQDERTHATALAYINKHLDTPKCHGMWPFVAGLLGLQAPALLQAFFAIFSLPQNTSVEREALAIRCLEEARLPLSQQALLAELQKRFVQTLLEDDRIRFDAYQSALQVSTSILNDWLASFLHLLTYDDINVVERTLRFVLPLSLHFPKENTLNKVLLGHFQSEQLQIKWLAGSILIRRTLNDEEEQKNLNYTLLLALGSENIEERQIAKDAVESLLKMQDHYADKLFTLIEEQYQQSVDSIGVLEKINHYYWLLDRLLELSCLLSDHQEKIFEYIKRILAELFETITTIDMREALILLDTLKILSLRHQRNPILIRLAKRPQSNTILERLETLFVTTSNSWLVSAILDTILTLNHEEDQLQILAEALSTHDADEFNFSHCRLLGEKLKQLGKHSDEPLKVFIERIKILSAKLGVSANTISDTNSIVVSTCLLIYYFGEALLMTEKHQRSVNVLHEGINFLYSMTAHANFSIAIVAIMVLSESGGVMILPSKLDRKGSESKQWINLLTRLSWLWDEENMFAAKQAFEQLIACIPDRYWHTIWRALLSSGVESKAVAIRTASVNTLGQLVCYRHIPSEDWSHLLRVALTGMEDKNASVRDFSTTFFVRLGPYIPQEKWPDLCATLIARMQDRYESSACGGPSAEILDRDPSLREKQEKELAARISSARALEQLVGSPCFPDAQRPSICQALLAGLQNSDHSVRRLSAAALGQLGSYMPKDQWDLVCRILLPCIQDSEWSVRDASVKALGQLGPNIPGPQWGRVLQALFNGMQNTSNVISVSSIEALGQLNFYIPQYVHIEVEAISLSSIDERMCVEDQHVLICQRLLAQMCHKTQYVVRVASTQALARLRNYIPANLWSQVLQALLRGMRDGKMAVRTSSAEVLGELGFCIPEDQWVPVVQALLKGVQDNKMSVRIASVKALGQLRGRIPQEQRSLRSQVLEAIFIRMKDKEVSVYVSSIEALGQQDASIINDSGTSPLSVEPWRQRRLHIPEDEWASLLSIEPLPQRDAYMLADEWTPVLQALLQGICNSEKSVYEASAKVLVQLLRSENFPKDQWPLTLEQLLIGMQYKESCYVRASCARVLGQLGHHIPEEQRDSICQALFNGVSDVSKVVCYSSANALAQFTPYLSVNTDAITHFVCRLQLYAHSDTIINVMGHFCIKGHQRTLATLCGQSILHAYFLGEFFQVQQQFKANDYQFDLALFSQLLNALVFLDHTAVCAEALLILEKLITANQANASVIENLHLLLETVLVESEGKVSVKQWVIEVQALFPASEPEAEAQERFKRSVKMCYGKHTVLGGSSSAKQSNQSRDAFGGDTLPDGNCAFNAFALGLARIIIEGRLFVLPDELELPFFNSQQEKKTALQNWVRQHASHKEKIQRDLSPWLRRLAIKIIRRDYQAHYRENFADQLRHVFSLAPVFDASHPFLSQQTILDAMQEYDDVDQFIEWWEREGKEKYFDELSKNAEGKSARYGGDLELTVLARLFYITIDYETEQHQRVGVLYGMCEPLNEEDAKLLHTLEITQEHRGVNDRRIHSYFSEGNKEKIAQVLADVPESLTQKINQVRNGDLTIADLSDEEKAHLARRKALAHNTHTLITNSDGSPDFNEVLFRLRNFSADVTETILHTHSMNIPIVTIEYADAHWTYQGLTQNVPDVSYVDDTSAVTPVPSVSAYPS